MSEKYSQSEPCDPPGPFCTNVYVQDVGYILRFTQKVELLVEIRNIIVSRLTIRHRMRKIVPSGPAVAATIPTVTLEDYD